jgi:hypothetical protein
MFNKLDYWLLVAISLHLSSLLSGLHLLGVLGGVVGLLVVLLGNIENSTTPTPPKPTTPTTPTKPIERGVSNGEEFCVLYNEEKTNFRTTKSI